MCSGVLLCGDWGPVTWVCFSGQVKDLFFGVVPKHLFS